MEGMSLKEKSVLAMVGVVLLYALAIGLWFLRQDGEWKKARKQYQSAVTKYREECRLIDREDELDEEYRQEKERMPTFPSGKYTDSKWLQTMDEIAKRNHVFISKRQAGEEVEAGEVYEIPIEVTGWEGALESLVHFLYELENSDLGMFDVSALDFRPSSKQGYLKGKFTLNCAYMRE